MSKKSFTKVIFDTNIYIDFFNQAKYREHIYEPDHLVYLSSVVLMELFVGSFSKKEIRSLDSLYKLYKKKNRIIVPNTEDYIEAGKLLSKLVMESGFDMRKSYWLINDVLIALSARRIGVTIYTQNKNDFEAINKFKKISYIIL